MSKQDGLNLSKLLKGTLCYLKFDSGLLSFQL